MQSLNNQESLEALRIERQTLKQRLKEITKEMYDLEPQVFNVVDEYSGRSFTMQRNSYKLSLKYPKVHPKTGRRLYEKRAHWSKNEHNNNWEVAYSMPKDFPDKEYISNKNMCSEDGYSLYEYERGWSRPGYYWKDVSSGYENARYIEREIPSTKLTKIK